MREITKDEYGAWFWIEDEDGEDLYLSRKRNGTIHVKGDLELDVDEAKMLIEYLQTFVGDEAP